MRELDYDKDGAGKRPDRGGVPSADLDPDLEGNHSDDGQSDDNEDYVPGAQRTKSTKPRTTEESYESDAESEIELHNGVTGANLDKW